MRYGSCSRYRYFQADLIRTPGREEGWMSPRAPSILAQEEERIFLLLGGTVSIRPFDLDRQIGELSRIRSEVATTGVLTSVTTGLSGTGTLTSVTTRLDLFATTALSWAERVEPTTTWPLNLRLWRWSVFDTPLSPWGMTRDELVSLVLDPTDFACHLAAHLFFGAEIPAPEPPPFSHLVIRLRLSAEMRDVVLCLLDRVLAVRHLARLLSRCALSRSRCLFVRSLTLILLAVARCFGLRGESDDHGLPALSTSSRRGALALAA